MRGTAKELGAARRVLVLGFGMCWGLWVLGLAHGEDTI